MHKISETQALLDRFLEAYLYSGTLMENGATKETHERADAMLKSAEQTLFGHLSVDTDEKFERLLSLVDHYRKDERIYPALLQYAESLR